MTPIEPSAPVERQTVLVVDDTPDNLTLMSGLLKVLYKVKLANSGEKAIQIVQSASPPDLILLDIMMPGLSGHDVCKILKDAPATRDIPIIFLTAMTGTEDEKKGLELGAVDFITKPVNPPIVLARVATQLTIKARQDELQRQQVMLQQQNDIIEASRKEIQEIHQHTRESIEYAAIIQHAILPEPSSLQSCFPESFAVWKPKDIVGGDVWFFEPLRSADESLLFVIDCTGHGVPGAFVTMLVKSIQRGIIFDCNKNQQEIHPGAMLAFFNREIKQLLDQQTRASESNAGFDGGILYLDKSRGIARYAGAETPLFLVDKDGRCTSIKGSRHSVGYRSCDAAFVFEEHELSLAAFDKIYLSTDGLLDQNGGPKDIPFGKKRLMSLIESHHAEPISKIEEWVMKELAQWRGEREQNDDICFVGINI